MAIRLSALLQQHAVLSVSQGLPLAATLCSRDLSDALSATGQLQRCTSDHRQQHTASSCDTLSCTPDLYSMQKSPDSHIADCSSITNMTQLRHTGVTTQQAGISRPWQHQQFRGYAAKGKGGGKAAPAPAAAPKAPKAVDPYAPPQWKMKRVPRGNTGDALAQATPAQRAVLQQLQANGSAPLRSLRQLGWPLGQQQVLALLHDQLADVAGTNVAVLPFVLDSMYQSATSLAQVVKDYLADGKGMPQVEQFLLTTIANIPAADIPFDGIKVAVKGRMGGKSGMTSQRVWTWGRPSAANLSDPVDYAHEAVITRAGYIGIKVWIRYKRSHLEGQEQRSSRSPLTVPQLLSMPAATSLPSRSSSAWWNIPGPWQPRQHKAWDCFKPGYDPLAAASTDKLAAQQQRAGVATASEQQ